METEVKIADFKSHLSEHLRAVRRGHEIIIKDRETPIARVAPYQAPSHRLVVRPPTRSFKEIEKILAARPRKRLRVKPNELEKAYRETRMDWYDKWKAGRFT